MTAIMPLTSHVGTRWPRSLVALIVARAVNQLGAFALAFLAVTLVEVRGASLTTAGWVVASFGIATIPSRLLGGRLADRFGRRSTIVAGLIGSAVALLVIAGSPGIPGTVVGAVLLGCAFEVYEPPSQALVAELVPPGRRPQAFGLLGAAIAIAGVASGLAAVGLGGVDLRLLFVADATTCLVAALLVALLVRDPVVLSPRRVRAGSPWRDSRLLIMLAVGTGSALVWNLAATTLPLTVVARGLDPASTGWLLAASAVVTVLGQPLLRGAAARPFASMSTGLVLFAAGFTVLALATGLLSFGAGAALVALGQVLLLGPPYAVVSGLAEDSTRAGYLAAYGTCWGIAQTFGPLVSTRLLAIAVPLPWLTGAVACLGLAALQPFVARAVRATG